MNPARRILSSFLNLSAGELIARLLNFAAFAHLAKVLGKTNLGYIGLMMTVASYLLIPVLQGFDSVGIRDVSRDRARLPAYAGSILAIRLISALVTWAVLAAVAPFLTPMAALAILFGLTLFPQALSLKWALQAAEDMRPVAIAGIVAQLGFAAAAFTISGPSEILRVPLYQLAGDAAGAALLAVFFRKRFGPVRFVFDWDLWKQLFRESAPLAVSTVLGTLLFNFDILALGWFQPVAAVGLYTVVYKLVVIFSTPLTLLQWSLLPQLARGAGQRGILEATARPAIRYLLAVFLPLPFAGFLIGDRALAFLFGPDYAAGAPALEILLLAVPLIALRSLFRIILVSNHLQRLDLWTVLAGTLTNVILNLALVPRWSIAGAAVSTLSSEVVILAGSYYFVTRRLEPLPVMPHVGRPLAAAALMFGTGWALQSSPFLVQATAAGAIYLSALFALRAVTWKELRSAL